MKKKANPPGKNQRRRMKQKKLREEAAEASREQDKPMRQVCEDEKGRKLTVFMGGEAEMDKRWNRLKMAQTLHKHLDSVGQHLETLQLTLVHLNKGKQHVKGDIRQMEDEVEALADRMREAMLENNLAEEAKHGIQLPYYPYPSCIADDEQAITGFEGELSKLSEKIKDLRRRINMDD